MDVGERGANWRYERSRRQEPKRTRAARLKGEAQDGLSK
jgi:hypothetical protein